MPSDVTPPTRDMVATVVEWLDDSVKRQLLTPSTIAMTNDSE
jgi:hypothetical protein